MYLSEIITTDPKQLKHFLDEQITCYNSLSFIAEDPVSVPHRFRKKQDIEIAGIIAATLSWGQRPQIITAASKILGAMDADPYNFLTGTANKEFKRFSSFVYRTFSSPDLLWFLEALLNIYREHDSLEEIFRSGYIRNHSIKEAIISFRNEMLKTDHLRRSEKHLADPSKGSAAKRINMFLRWMVRRDDHGVDFGIWKSISPAHLMCPLDVHSGRTARKLGLLHRRQDDWRAVEELTTALRNFDPDDPVKYDFALFGMAING